MGITWWLGVCKHNSDCVKFEQVLVMDVAPLIMLDKIENQFECFWCAEENCSYNVLLPDFSMNLQVFFCFLFFKYISLIIICPVQPSLIDY